MQTHDYTNTFLHDTKKSSTTPCTLLLRYDLRKHTTACVAANAQHTQMGPPYSSLYFDRTQLNTERLSRGQQARVEGPRNSITPNAATEHVQHTHYPASFCTLFVHEGLHVVNKISTCPTEPCEDPQQRQNDRFTINKRHARTASCGHVAGPVMKTLYVWRVTSFMRHPRGTHEDGLNTKSYCYQNVRSNHGGAFFARYKSWRYTVLAGVHHYVTRSYTPVFHENYRAGTPANPNSRVVKTSDHYRDAPKL